MNRVFNILQEMRPRTIQEYIGQFHLIGPGKELIQIFNAPVIPSLILHGPPGTGKTTIAHLLGQKKGYHLIAHHCFRDGKIRSKKDRQYIDISSVIKNIHGDLSRSSIKIILFLDEFHRCTMSQQQLLFDAILNGEITFMGATYIRLSRPQFFSELIKYCRIVELKKHSAEDLRQILKDTLTDKERGLADLNIKIDADAEELLCQSSDGNAKELFRILQKVLILQFMFAAGQKEKKLTSRSIQHISFHITKADIEARLNQ